MAAKKNDNKVPAISIIEFIKSKMKGGEGMAPWKTPSGSGGQAQHGVGTNTAGLGGSAGGHGVGTGNAFGPTGGWSPEEWERRRREDEEMRNRKPDYNNPRPMDPEGKGKVYYSASNGPGGPPVSVSGGKPKPTIKTGGGLTIAGGGRINTGPAETTTVENDDDSTWHFTEPKPFNPGNSPGAGANPNDPPKVLPPEETAPDPDGPLTPTPPTTPPTAPPPDDPPGTTPIDPEDDLRGKRIDPNTQAHTVDPVTGARDVTHDPIGFVDRARDVTPGSVGSVDRARDVVSQVIGTQDRARDVTSQNIGPAMRSREVSSQDIAPTNRARDVDGNQYRIGETGRARDVTARDTRDAWRDQFNSQIPLLEQRLGDEMTQQNARTSALGRSGSGLHTREQGRIFGRHQATREGMMGNMMYNALQQDAGRNLQAQGMNQQSDNMYEGRAQQGRMFNADLGFRGDLANQASDNQYEGRAQQGRMFNSAQNLQAQGMNQQSDDRYADRSQQGQMFNSAQNLQAQGMNQRNDQFGNQLDQQANMFNSGQNLQAQGMNQRADMWHGDANQRGDMFNQNLDMQGQLANQRADMWHGGMQQQANMFNSGQDMTGQLANQRNDQWMQGLNSQIGMFNSGQQTGNDRYIHQSLLGERGWQNQMSQQAMQQELARLGMLQMGGWQNDPTNAMQWNANRQQAMGMEFQQAANQGWDALSALMTSYGMDVSGFTPEQQQMVMRMYGGGAG